jgi:hypothetical protein
VIFHPIIGGGATLSVKAYPSESDLPSSARDGDIAVLSQTAVGDVYIQSAEPTDVKNGDLWVTFGFDGNYPSFAGNVVIYPKIAYQYIDGSKTKLDMYVWSNSMWNGLKVYLLKGSDKCEDVTGGWKTYTIYDSTVSETTTGFKIQGANDGYQAAGIQTKTSIDISGYNTITFKGKVTTYEDNNEPCFGIRKSKASNTDSLYSNAADVSLTKGGSYTVNVDVSGYTGAYYVGAVSGSVMTVTEIYME